METLFFSSLGHSDEETTLIELILAGKILPGTECQKYKVFSGAKRPKIQKISRTKRAKMKENEAFCVKFRSNF